MVERIPQLLDFTSTGETVPSQLTESTEGTSIRFYLLSYDWLNDQKEWSKIFCLKVVFMLYQSDSISSLGFFDAQVNKRTPKTGTIILLQNNTV